MSKSRILVAVSSPWASEKVTAPLADLAQRLDADTIIAHVAQVREDDEKETDARQRGEQTLKVLTDAFKARDLPAEGVMLFSNDVAKAIVRTAKARSCTLIVLGTTHKNLFRRLVAGDVPRDILRQVDLPVLMWPAGAAESV